MAADLLPTLAIGVALVMDWDRCSRTRATVASPSQMGLSVTEGGVTGFVTGSLLKPIDADNDKSESDFWRLRAMQRFRHRSVVRVNDWNSVP